MIFIRRVRREERAGGRRSQGEPHNGRRSPKAARKNHQCCVGDEHIVQERVKTCSHSQSGGAALENTGFLKCELDTFG